MKKLKIKKSEKVIKNKKSKVKKERKISDKAVPYIFVGPWIFGFFVFTLIPLILCFIFSFCYVQMAAGGISLEFVGLDNYKNIFTQNAWLVQDFIQMFFYLLIIVPLIIVFSIVISLLLNNTHIKGRGAYRAIFFLPVIIMSGPMLMSLINNGIMVMPTFGEISAAAAATGSTFMIIISKILNSFVLIMWCTGVPVLIFLAGLQKMNGAVYEAASIDGATGWETFWKITFPNLKGMIILNTLYVTIFVATLPINSIIGTIETNMFLNPSAEGVGGAGWSSAVAWIYFAIMLLVLGIIGGLANGSFGKKDR